jgi:hypothetical protein
VRFPLIAQCNNGTATNEELDYLYAHDREIKFDAFARHVDLQDLSERLGYAFGPQKGLHLRKDWHVRFFISRFRGKRCYHLDWSHIDHIFGERTDCQIHQP